jgi:NAD-dependent SIR2 family protein deacetylase
MTNFSRFIVLARDLGKKVAVVNIGTTRADDIVDLKVNAKASDVLREINW